METQSCCTVVSLPQRNKILRPNQATDPKNLELKRGFGPWPISTWRQGRVCFPQSHPKLPIALPDPAATIWPSSPFLLRIIFIFTTCFEFFKLQWDIFTFQVLQQKSKPPARSWTLDWIQAGLNSSMTDMETGTWGDKGIKTRCLALAGNRKRVKHISELQVRLWGHWASAQVREPVQMKKEEETNPTDLKCLFPC